MSDTLTLIAIILAAVLGSTVLTTVVERFFRKDNDSAEAGKTRAEAADILTTATTNAIKMMENNLRLAQERILALESRVLSLESEVAEYYKKHGPLEGR